MKRQALSLVRKAQIRHNLLHAIDRYGRQTVEQLAIKCNCFEDQVEEPVQELVAEGLLCPETY